jgi:branched-chain amino acid transport system ATP-binding protein
MAMGIAMVPEGRKLFPSLSVEENLQIGAHGRQTGGYWSLETVYELFPVLKERRAIPARRFRAGSNRWSRSGGR